jgi:hypothetical protein
MIVELLTPLILASAPAIVEVDTATKYDHSQQIVEARLDPKTLSFTTSGTQTYMPNGRPFDADND